jgi:hypothetical protein
VLRILTLLLVCSACSFTGAHHFDLEEVRAQYERDQAAFSRAQADLERRYPVPMRLDFEGAGSLFVDRVALVGRPGKAFLRIHFTWVNTTSEAYPVVDVRLTQRDSTTDIEWSETLEMRLPFKYSLGPDSSYTSWFESSTHGVHLREGWDWELHVRPDERHPRADG